MPDVEQGDVAEVELLAPGSGVFRATRDELRELNEVRRRPCRVYNVGPPIRL